MTETGSKIYKGNFSQNNFHVEKEAALSHGCIFNTRASDINRNNNSL